MITPLEPGLYVVAVSGGVDSVALLHMVSGMPQVRVVVAHFDHGMREDSALDRELVENLAQQYGMSFVAEEGRLEPNASEDQARRARYAFLYRIRVDSSADAIVTAHHHDDVLETAILNLLRGTHRKGLTSLKSTELVKRPLLNVSKQELVQYARANNLAWREDSTNQDLGYKRNLVRHQLVAKMTSDQRIRLGEIINRMHKLNTEIDSLVSEHLDAQPSSDIFNRRHFIRLPHTVSLEVLAEWLRSKGARDFDRRSLNRITVAAKTFAPGSKIDVDFRFFIEVQAHSLALRPRVR